jgi:hypothetical protein
VISVQHQHTAHSVLQRKPRVRSSRDRTEAAAQEVNRCWRQLNTGSVLSYLAPLVSREHLQRQLRAWVGEGRLVKAAHNCFTLPKQPV